MSNITDEPSTSLPLKGKKQFSLKTIATFGLVLLVIFGNYLFFNKAHSTKTMPVADSYNLTNQTPLTKQVSDNMTTQNIVNPKPDLQQKIQEAKAKDFIDRLQVSQTINTGEMNNNMAESHPNSENSILSASSDQPMEDANTAFLVRASHSKSEKEYATHFGPLPYVIGQGKFIFGALAVAINSDLPGQIEAVVSQDVYGEQGKIILIPRGSHLIGEYRSILSNHQNRLFTVWTRIKEPNGIDIALGSEGTDALGRAGLAGTVDYHFIDRFGGALLISMIGAGAANIGVSTSDQYNSASAYRQSVAQSLADEAKNTLSQSITIPPTITIPQGEKIVVFVNKDLDFSRVYS